MGYRGYEGSVKCKIVFGAVLFNPSSGSPQNPYWNQHAEKGAMNGTPTFCEWRVSCLRKDYPSSGSPQNPYWNQHVEKRFHRFYPQRDPKQRKAHQRGEEDESYPILRKGPRHTVADR
jgi:hypothetical protein